MAGEKEKPKIVPCLSVEWPEGERKLLYSFDAAWHFARSRPIPNMTKFIDWMREDDAYG